MITSELRVLHLAGTAADAALLADAVRGDRAGHITLSTVASLRAGLELLARHSFDAALVALELPDSSGLATLEQVHQAAPALPIVVYTHSDDDDVTTRAIQAGAYDCLIAGRGELAMAPRILRHVVARHTADVRLHESEAFSTASFHADLIPKIITALPEGRIIDINDAFSFILGYAREEVIGRTTVEIGLWANLDDRNDALHLLRTEGRVRNREYGFRTRTGTTLVMQVSFEPVMLKGQQCLISTTLDLTQFRRVMEQLQVSERTLKLFVEYAPAAIAMFDRNMNYLAVSRRFLSDYELGDQTLVGRSHYEVFPEIPQRWKDINQRCLAGAVEKCEEDTLLRANGRIDWIRWEMHPWHAPSGEIGGIILFSEVITERKQAIERLRESEKYLRLAYDAADIGIWRNDLSTGMVHLDERARTHYGLSTNDIHMGELLACVHAEDVDRLRAETATATGPAGTGKSYTEHRVIHPDGSVHWLATGVRLFFEGEGAARHATIAYGTTLDITERKQAETRLRQSEEQYRSLMESLDNVIATVDSDGRFVFMNDVAAAQLGGTPNAFIGKTFFDLFPEAIARRQFEHVRLAFREDKGSVYETEIIVQGKVRWYRTWIQPIHDEQGNVANVLINSMDIHELKVAQQELMELNQTLETRVRERTAEVQDLYDNAPAGYHSLDADGCFLLINQTELNWLGYTRDEVVGRPFTDFITAESRKTFEANFPTFKQRGWVRDLEFEMIRKDGSTFPIVLNATAIRDEAGQFLMSRSTILDNTERHAAEVALRESEAQNRLLFEESPDAILLMRSDGRIMRANRAYAELTKYPLDKIIGSTAKELGIVSQGEIERLSTIVGEVLGTKPNVISAEYRLHDADGAVLDVESRFFPLRIQSADHILLTTHDVTTHRMAEERLRLANMELGRAMRLKDEFLANMSHELRTPLTGVLALSEVLLEKTFGPLNERQLKALQNIESSGRHLLALINDLLDLSRIEAGRLDLEIRLVSVDEVCRSSIAFVKEAAHKKKIQLTYRNQDEEAKVNADERRLRQMLVNLLSNAVKFTPEGGKVRLDVAVDREKHTIEFAVCDTGPGIAPEEQGRLFQPFTQLDSTLSRQFEGTGLGLALVKRLATQHGGSVHVESTGVAGEGSRFSIVLPNAYAEPAALPVHTVDSAAPDHETVATPATGHHILLAEDNPMTRELLTDFLTGRGYEVSIAATGLDAVELAGRQPPDLFLIDIQLPLLDGIEVIRQLRADVRFRTTPIIALTALAMMGDRDRCLKAGATEYMSKPFRVMDLITTIGKLLQP